MIKEQVQENIRQA